MVAMAAVAAMMAMVVVAMDTEEVVTGREAMGKDSLFSVINTGVSCRSV